MSTMSIRPSMEMRGLLEAEDGEDEENSRRDDGEVDFETAITATGYGWFHYWLVLIGGMANASDAVEILCVSILLPAAQCDLHMSSFDKGLLNSGVFLGMMVGGYVWGSLGDIYGRKRTLVVSLVVNAVSGLASAFAQGFPLFFTLRLLSGIGVGGSIPLVWAYISEFQPANKRGGALSVIAAFWMVGNVLVALFALAIIPFDIGYESPNFKYNSWRIFLTVCAIPSLIISILFIYLPESPMYLLMRGRQGECVDTLRVIYARNTNKPPRTYPVRAITTADIKVQTQTAGGRWAAVRDVFVQSWRQSNALFSRSLLRTTVLMLLINFAIQFGYYGLWLWFPELFNRLQLYYNDHPGDKVSVCDLTSYQSNRTDTSQCHDGQDQVDPQALVNVLITSIAPLPANLWTIFYMDSLGRRFFLALSMFLSGGAAFGIYFVKSATDNLVLSCVFGAVSTMGFNALDCLGAELFPTHLRSTALAVTLLAARVGAIAGSMVFASLIDVNCTVPMMMVAALLIAGGGLGLLLPNTTRTALT